MMGSRMLRLKQKGQGSFEFLLVMLFIIFISLLVLNSWFSISDETQALVLMKTMTVEKLNSADDFYTLRKIEIIAGDTPEDLAFNLYITPKASPELEEEIRSSAQEVEDNTKYTDIILYFP